MKQPGYIWGWITIFYPQAAWVIGVKITHTHTHTLKEVISVKCIGRYKQRICAFRDERDSF